MVSFRFGMNSFRSGMKSYRSRIHSFRCNFSHSVASIEHLICGKITHPRLLCLFSSSGYWQGTVSKLSCSGFVVKCQNFESEICNERIKMSPCPQCHMCFSVDRSGCARPRSRDPPCSLLRRGVRTPELQTKVKRRFAKILKSQRRPPLGPLPGWKCLLVLSHLRHY